MARPRKRNEEQLSEQRNVRLSKGEAARLRALARAGRISASEVVRRLIREGRIEVRRTREPPVEVVVELSRQGVNLNQMAHKLNATGQLVPEELSRTLDRLNALLDEVQGGGAEAHER